MCIFRIHDLLFALQPPSFACFACPYSQNALVSRFSIFPPLLLFFAPHPSIRPAIATTPGFVRSKKRRLSSSWCVSSHLLYPVQIYPGAVELMQVIEEFIHIVGLGMKDFHNAYLMTGNLGKDQRLLPPSRLAAPSSFYHLFLPDTDT